jgi:hypothetical protein
MANLLVIRFVAAKLKAATHRIAESDQEQRSKQYRQNPENARMYILMAAQQKSRSRRGKMSRFRTVLADRNKLTFDTKGEIIIWSSE